MKQAAPSTKQLIEHLARYATRNKITRMREVLNGRTRYVTLVLEDIHKGQNASATLRTCECLGVQDIHVIENSTRFTVDEEVTIGASKWVTMHRYRHKHKNNTGICFDSLRSAGYRIVAMSPDAEGRLLKDIPPDTRLAFVFGNEEQGLSDCALRSADIRVRLPMYGFTRSYNISVSVAITLSFILEKVRESGVQWHLSGEEKQELMLQWCRKAVRGSALIEKEFLKQQKVRDL